MGVNPSGELTAFIRRGSIFLIYGDPAVARPSLKRGVVAM
jgi:hypothetical protein